MSSSALDALARHIEAIYRRLDRLEAFDAPHLGVSARVTNSAAISIPSGTATALTFDTERWDPRGLHSTTTNTDRLTVIDAGVYAAWGNVRFAASATGYRQARIRYNGATVIASTLDNNPAASSAVDLSLAAIWDMAAGDYVTLEVYQNSGGALDAQKANAVSPEFAIWRLL